MGGEDLFAKNREGSSARRQDSPAPINESFRRSELDWICREVLRAASPTFQNTEVAASFYPYLGLTHTIRKAGARWIIRVSDHCRHAPPLVLEAIIQILACKLLRRRPPKRLSEIYDRFQRDPEVAAAVRARRLQRGRKRISTNSLHHSLREIYDELNARYFNGQLEVSRIGWGSQRSWGRLGHFDTTHRTITVSPVLDSPKVPRLVVSYLVYHEMLHAFFDEALEGCRTRHHPPEFHRAERQCPEYAEAKKFLAVFCRTRGNSRPRARARQRAR